MAREMPSVDELVASCRHDAELLDLVVGLAEALAERRRKDRQRSASPRKD